MVDSYPLIEDSRLIEGQVLVQMRAVPLVMSELNADGMYTIGDIYGSQGIGQVRLLGPRVSDLKVGDWVLPLRDVDTDGDTDFEAPPPGTARVLGVWKAERCLKLDFSADSPLTIANMALVKSISAACLLVREHAQKLSQGDAVILNCANGLVGQVLIQLLADRGFRVFAVVRKHTGEDWIRQKLEGLGAAKVFLDSEDIRSIVEEMGWPLPVLALDGVGGPATARLVHTLHKTGDLVRFGAAGNSNQQAVTLATGRKWMGKLLQFSFDEWLNKDVARHSKLLNEMLVEFSGLLRKKKMQLVLKEYTSDRLSVAALNARQIGRTHAVVLHLPRLEDNRRRDENALAVPGLELDKERPWQHRSWDLQFLEWEESGAEEEYQWRRDKENLLFRPNPIAEDSCIQRYLDDTKPLPIAQELGARAGEANTVMFWLPGRGEIPQEHTLWLERLCVCNPGLRAIILEPHQLEENLKWFEITDNEAVQLGLRCCVTDDELTNLETLLNESSDLKGTPTTTTPLLPAELDVLQQVECAALGLKRRADLEAEQLRPSHQPGALERLPFFFGGFGQGGAVALYAAACLMQVPAEGVIFCHSGIPAASLLLQRLHAAVRSTTELHAVYDKEDQEVPPSFPETLHQLLSLAKCRASLHWLSEGDGHEFRDEAADTVVKIASAWLEERSHCGDIFRSPG
eukprot:TRINITY_DN10067_c0_g1_i3.p1 TRINITY_DN10067_c0_g1~~TRINITY_DN10067_c0_g1_i3.p1  ORF type:complete len:686 (+),score=163.16 TRINITY_DN10067_c0_g1_i3:272-2329(+)